MTQSEKRLYLLSELLKEQPRYTNVEIPTNTEAQKLLLRSLFNIRMPKPVSEEFLKVQDAYLQEAIAQKGVTRAEDLTPEKDNLYLWQGDITTLQCDAIVNAANSRMLGCFCPCHGCIDNAIHTFSGIQLRLTCAALMQKQGREEETGKAKITPAFNLPSKYILHTVGPIVRSRVTPLLEAQLADCYRSCLALAAQNGIKSLAFCCISTGEFRFPNEKAAEIAIRTVTKFTAKTQRKIKVIFNVFKDADYEIYRKLLHAN